MNTHLNQRKNTLVHDGALRKANRSNVHGHGAAMAAFIEEFKTAYFSLPVTATSNGCAEKVRADACSNSVLVCSRFQVE